MSAMTTETILNGDPKPVRCCRCGRSIDPFREDLHPDLFGGFTCDWCWWKTHAPDEENDRP